MGKINYTLLACFRHQLRIEQIEVLEEFQYGNSTMFVIDEYSLAHWQVANLSRICSFSILMLYYKGEKMLHLRLFNDE